MIKKFAGVNIAVKDLDAAVKKYEGSPTRPFGTLRREFLGRHGRSRHYGKGAYGRRDHGDDDGCDLYGGAAIVYWFWSETLF